MVAVDISPPLSSVTISPRENVLLVAHGLTGGSHEPYVRAVLARATPGADAGGLGARAVVLNFRGCNGSPVVTPRLYHVRLPSRLPCWAGRALVHTGRTDDCAAGRVVGRRPARRALDMPHVS